MWGMLIQKAKLRNAVEIRIRGNTGIVKKNKTVELKQWPKN
jgi:hypothetical protein